MLYRPVDEVRGGIALGEGYESRLGAPSASVTML